MLYLMRKIPVFATALICLALVWTVATASGSLTRVSVSSSGQQGNEASVDRPAISADGRFVAFTSYADNFAVDDTNNVSDIFVHDRQTGQTTLVSVASDGTPASGIFAGCSLGWIGCVSHSPSISADGRYVTFISLAPNLVANDRNQREDVFLHDRASGQTKRVSVSSTGGRGNQRSYEAVISADGNYVAFTTVATSLDSENLPGVFLHTVATGETKRVSISSAGDPAHNGYANQVAISANGQIIAFSTQASNLVPSDTNGRKDIFIHNQLTGQTESLTADLADNVEGVSSPSLSVDGRYAAYIVIRPNGNSTTNYRYDVYLHDRLSGVRTPITLPHHQSDQPWMISATPSISADGRLVAFGSNATNIVANDANGKRDIFVYDRLTEKTTRVSTASDETEAADGAVYPYANISADGHFVTFSSSAPNLVQSDTNEFFDTYVKEINPPLVVDAITLLNPNPVITTSPTTVQFEVVFSDNVMGVDASDFDLTVAGNGVNAAITNVSGNGRVYVVTVNVRPNGTVRLDIATTANISSQTGVALSQNPARHGGAYLVIDHALTHAVYLPIVAD